MSKRLNDQDQTRMAIAALFAAFVETLREQDEGLPSRFDRHLERICLAWKDWKGVPDEAIATLRWTSELLKQIRDQ